jgi:hypothetical protein
MSATLPAQAGVAGRRIERAANVPIGHSRDTDARVVRLLLSAHWESFERSEPRRAVDEKQVLAGPSA